MKKALLFALILSLFCSFRAYAEQSAYYNETSLPDGSRIVYMECESIPSPRGGGAYMYDKCGVLAPDGTFLVEPVYKSIYAPVEGRAMFQAETGYGYFDENWNVAIPAQFLSAQSFSEGLAAVSDAQWSIGYIDRDGNTVIPFQYASGGAFHNGVASVTVSEEGYSSYSFLRTGTIDRQGNVVDPLIFRYEQKTFDILMSENLIEINGKVYQNDSLSYPFINYLGYSYIPLTYGTCRALGFSCDWTDESGLVLYNSPDIRLPEMGENTMEHGEYDQAVLYKGSLTINGKTFTAGDVYYPLLYYRDIIYLPVLFREGMELLNITYTYHLGEGDTMPGYMVFEQSMP